MNKFSAYLAGLLCLLLWSSARLSAQSGIYESYVVLNINGGGNSYYDLQAVTGNPDFQGADLGSFSSGQTLVFAGGENKTWKCAPCDITNGYIWYRVWTGSPSGAFNGVNLPWAENLGTGCGGNDQKWSNTSNTTDVLSGLTPGTYTLEVYSTADYLGCGTGTHYASNGGANYMATFTILCPDITVNGTVTDASCAGGGNDGAIDITVSGGTPFPITQTHTDNFNSLANTGTSNVWTDNSTLSGWYSNRTVYIASTGTSATGGLYSFGTDASDRAIGSLGSGTATPIHYGVAITNTTGVVVNSVQVAYTGEQWRCGGTSAVTNVLDFTYQINAASITAGVWTDYNALDFSSPVSSGTAAALDGNNPANRQIFDQTISLTLNPGETIWLRWTDVDNTSSDHGLAVDDLTVTLHGADGTYNYLWTTGATSEDVSGLSSDPYSVTVTDANGYADAGTGNFSVALSGQSDFYADSDADGFGDPDVAALACSAPSGYVSDNTDCNDASDSVYPGATEVCNGIDEDCNGAIDDGASIAAPVIDPSGVIQLCKPESITLSVPAGYDAYQWYKNGNPQTGANSDSYLVYKPGYYQVEVTVGTCTALSDPQAVAVSNRPVANISAPFGTSLCTAVKLKVTYDASYTYQWLMDGNPIPGETDYKLVPTAGGVYACVVTNPAGCSRTSDEITVTECRTGAMVDNDLQVYPNPSQGTVLLHAQFSDATEMVDVKVFTTLGALVYSDQVAIVHGSLAYNMDLSALPNGMYSIQCNAGIETLHTQVVLQK
ncbi:MAG: MopE-related protein [Chitinophagales bacterium]